MTKINKGRCVIILNAQTKKLRIYSQNQNVEAE